MSKGFTLIEIMIAVAIVAILAAIAYPSYQQYIIRTHRADLQTELLRVAGQLQSYKVVNHTYENATLNNVGGSANFPRTANPDYQIALVLDNDNRGYTLTATPIVTSTQKGNGIVVLNNEGQKCWIKGATTCALSTTSTWDN